MAHHGSTPRSILDAPKLTPRWLVRHAWPNRAARRHRMVRIPGHGIGELDKRAKTIPAHVRLPAVNRPYRKPRGDEP